ncbi:MAG: iron ABC transporter permease [Synergistaceae bacterium]|jgi:iron complex transport system permease protein|nr:iron ABC transporter permease [Synergistaceae bacterium]
MTDTKRLPAAFGYAAVLSVLIVSVFCGLYFGPVPMSLWDLLAMLDLGPRGVTTEAAKYTLVWDLRVPRVMTAAMSGAVLASGGVMFQAVLRNPLAEPYTLGVASGASFGASMAIFFGVGWITASAFAGSAGAMLLVWFLGERDGHDVSGTVLAGVIVGSILGAALTLLKAIAGDKMNAMVMWMMGSFSAAGWQDVRPMSWALCLVVLLSLAYFRELDIMASGSDGEALGVDVARVRLTLLAGVSLAVSFVVSRFGVIGFVGLVVPHLLRILFGPSHRNLLPLSLAGGAALMCAADTIAKGFNELPSGVLTVLVGGPVFCFILWRRK